MSRKLYARVLNTFSSPISGMYRTQEQADRYTLAYDEEGIVGKLNRTLPYPIGEHSSSLKRL